MSIPVLAIPGDLVITIDRSPSEATLVPVRQILSVPAVAEPIWDGPDVPAAAPEPPFILFSFGWMRHFAGTGFEDVCRMAARIGACLAAIEDGWPTAEAHLRALPVVDTSFSFLVAPHEIAPGQGNPSVAEFTEALAAELDAGAPDTAASLRRLAADAERCCGEGCGCQ